MLLRVLLLSVAALLAPASAATAAAHDRPASGAAHGLAPTPPMGWNSWNAFGKDINEQLIRDTADAMVASGMRDAGYRYVVIDGGWRAPDRDANGDMQVDRAKFPNGIAGVADYVHSKGLLLGLHQAVGMTDCGGTSPGTQSAPDDSYAEKARRDARTFASWGVDYVKFDRCRFEFPADSSPGAPDVDAITVRAGDDTIAEREAESHANDLAGGARVVACASCSGGRMVAAIGIDGGALTLRHVTVPRTGDYDLDLHFVYVNRGQFDSPRDESYAASLRVDGGPRIPIEHQAAQPQDGTPFTITVSAHLHAGSNTIAIDDPESEEEILRRAYVDMGRALDATGRPIVYSLSGPPRPWYWAAGVADLARTTKDIKPLWDSGNEGQAGPMGIINITDLTAPLAGYAHPGYWNDPDMLEVGVSLPKFPGLTADENRSHFSLWAMMAAPLIAGADLRSMTADTRDILTNRAVLAVDQDPAGIQGVRTRDDGDHEVWVKPLADGDRAVLLLNRSPEAADMATTAREAGLPGARGYVVHDLWEHSSDVTRGPITARVPPHGVAMFRVEAMRGYGRR